MLYQGPDQRSPTNRRGTDPRLPNARPLMIKFFFIVTVGKNTQKINFNSKMSLSTGQREKVLRMIDEFKKNE